MKRIFLFGLLLLGLQLSMNSSEVQKPALPNIRIAAYFTGADAGAKIAAAIADLPSTGGTVDARGLEGAQAFSTDICTGIGAKPVLILLGAATITVSATQTCNTEKISILGLGPSQTVLNCTVNGDCLRIRTSAFNTNKAGSFGGFQMVGNSGANAVAIHIGDIIGTRLQDLWITDFTGASSAGIWFDNVTNWTEQTLVENVRIQNATKSLRFTVNGGTSSFQYTTFSRVSLEIQNAQTAISGENNSALTGSVLDITINKSGAASGTILALANTSTWVNNTYHVIAENNGGGGGTGISLAAGTTLDGRGTIVAAGLANSISGTLTTNLNYMSGTATTGVVESAQTIAARTATFLGTYVQPQLGAAGSFRQGLGLNVHFDGSNWITEGDGGANNGATAILGGYANPATLQFFTVNSTGASDQTITNAVLDSTHLRMTLNSTGLGIDAAPSSKLDVRTGDIRLGFDQAATNKLIKTFTTAHAAGNVPSQLDFGVDDGGGTAGLLVKNVRDGAFNSQSLEFATAHGGVSLGTKLTIDKDGNATFTNQVISTLASGTAPFSITSTTPVSNLTTVPTTYNKSGTQQTATHLVQDTCTLGTDCAVTLTGAAVFTNSTSYTCVCEDDSAIAACRVSQSSGSAFTITGTGIDVIRFICVGN